MKKNIIKKSVSILMLVTMLLSCVGCNPTDLMQGGVKSYEELPILVTANLDRTAYMYCVPNIAQYSSLNCHKYGTRDYFTITNNYGEGTDDDIDISSLKNPSDIFNVLYEEILDDAENWIGYSEDYSYVVEETEDMTVNGIKMCRFTGYFESYDNVDTRKDYSTHNFVGYGFFFEGYPVYMISVDISLDQSQGDFIIDLTDKMIETFQKYEEEKIEDYDFIARAYDSMYSKITFSTKSESYAVDTYCADIELEKDFEYDPVDDYKVFSGKYFEGISDVKYGITLKEISSPSKVLEVMKPQFDKTLSKTLYGAESYNSVIDKSEEITINGRKMCRYLGHFEFINPEDEDYKSATLNFIAYSTIVDDCPVYFGILDDTIEHKTTDEIIIIADKMANTFREYKNPLIKE